MTDLELSWFGPVLAEDFTFFQVLKVANSYFRPAGFTPVGHDTAGHMLEVIIIEKIPFRLLKITLMARLEVSQTLALLVPRGA